MEEFNTRLIHCSLQRAVFQFQHRAAGSARIKTNLKISNFNLLKQSFCRIGQYGTNDYPMNEFGTFAKFYNPQEAEPLLYLLESNNIPFTITQEVNQLDPVIVGHSFDPLFNVSVPVHRFEEINELLSGSVIPSGDAAVSPESEEDLFGEFKQERLAIQWIVLGYLFSLVSVVGIFMGMTLITSSKRLKNGEKLRRYNDHTVTHGRIMVATGILSTLWFIWRKFIKAD